MEKKTIPKSYWKLCEKPINKNKRKLEIKIKIRKTTPALFAL